MWVEIGEWRLNERGSMGAGEKGSKGAIKRHWRIGEHACENRRNGEHCVASISSISRNLILINDDSAQQRDIGALESMRVRIGAIKNNCV